MRVNDAMRLPLEDPRLQWEARQVLRERGGEPHLFLRLRLKGGYFPRRGVAPFVQIGGLRSAFVEIAADEESLCAYFDRPPGDNGVVEFGYGDDPILRLCRPFTRSQAAVLGLRCLPPNTRNLERFRPAPPAPAGAAPGGRDAAGARYRDQGGTTPFIRA